MKKKLLFAIFAILSHSVVVFAQTNTKQKSAASDSEDLYRNTDLERDMDDIDVSALGLMTDANDTTQRRKNINMSLASLIRSCKDNWAAFRISSKYHEDATLGSPGYQETLYSILNRDIIAREYPVSGGKAYVLECALDTADKDKAEKKLMLDAGIFTAYLKSEMRTTTKDDLPVLFWDVQTDKNVIRFMLVLRKLEGDKYERKFVAAVVK